MVSVDETETEMTVALILNLIFDLAVVVGIVGLLAWSIAAQHRDSGVTVPRWAWRRRLAGARPRIGVARARPDARPWPAR